MVAYRTPRSKRTRYQTRVITKAEPADRRPPDVLVAISASRHMVDLLVLAADDAEDLQFRGSRGGSVSDWPRCAPCLALIRGKTPTSWDGRSFPGFRQTRASRRRRASGAAKGSAGAPAFSREQGGVDVRSASLSAPLRRPSREQSHAPCNARRGGQTAVGQRRRASITERGSGLAGAEGAARPAGRA